MGYFTVDIQGLPTAAFRCDDKEGAAEILDAAYFREDLLVLTNLEGRPLWDGEVPLNLRKATVCEGEALEAVWTLDDDDLKRMDDEYIAFLVPVFDPTDD